MSTDAEGARTLRPCGVPTSGLHAAVRIRRPALELRLRVGLGEVLAVVGLPAADATMLAATIAGLRRPEGSRITLDGQVLVDTATGVHVPAHRRPVGLLDARPLLFPDMSVAEHVASGALLEGADPRDAEAETRRRLADVRMSAFGDLPLADATTEQAWRVALARLLATEVDVLLLDDPLAGLDVGAARRARSLLRPLLWDRITLLLTSDDDDAARLADRTIDLAARVG